MTLWLATTNPGKKAEIKNMFMGESIKVSSLADIENYYPPKEDGNSFKENALIKAKSLRARISDEWILGEDSGLVVEGLDGLPGIHSARYAGEKATDHDNVAKLMKMVNLRTPTNRKAHFVCSLAVISPDGETFHYEETVHGEISKKVSGSSGFGYDVCFIPEGETETFATLGVAFKNKVSHRKKALKLFKEELKSRL